MQPELVIVSAGYDSALGDQEVRIENNRNFSYKIFSNQSLQGKMEVTPACYSHLVSMLSSLANGKIAVVLEGGYCFQSLAEGAALTLKTLLGDPCPNLIEPLEAPCPSISDTILNCIYTLRPYWKCLRVNATYDKHVVSTNQTDVHQVIQSFDFKEPYPQVWPTRAFYAKSNKGICAERLLKLMNNTSLLVPQNRLCYAIDVSEQ